MTLETTTITGLPDASTPLTGTERVPMDMGDETKDATTQDIANLAGPAITSAVAAHVAAADPHPSYLLESDSAVTNAREWIADTISQAEAEAGTATTRRAFTAQRVRQAITAWWSGASTAAGRALVEAADAVAQRLALGLGATDSPTFAGLTIAGTAPVVIPHIHGAIAGNVYLHVRNTSGGTLAAGTCVRVTGSVGSTDRLEVTACDPTDSTKMPAVGVLETSLANNADGDAIIAGELRPLNTAAFTLGRQLYVGAAGALTDSVPTSGVVQAVGSVARVNASTGTIAIGIGSRWPGLVTTTTAGLMPATSYAAITYASTVNLDLATLNGQTRIITVSGGNLTLTTSNLAVGRTLKLRLIGDTVERDLTLPGWKFIGLVKPTKLPANKVMRITIESFGTTDGDCDAVAPSQT